MLLRVVAPHFVAGIEFRDDVAIRAAPILKWAVGKELGELERYFRRRDWKAERMITHVMTDIESLSTRPGAVVMSVAFVRCHDEASFTMNWSIPEQQALGLEIDPETHAWWGEQEAKYPGSWLRSTENPQSLNVALPYVGQWLQWATGGGEFRLWCHHKSFDTPLMTEVYRRVGIPCPWEFWQVRDTPTAYDMALINHKDYAVPPPHVSLNDAIGQSRALMASFAIIARAHQSSAPTLPLRQACPICHQPQFDTPSGVTCINGHGGEVGI